MEKGLHILYSIPYPGSSWARANLTGLHQTEAAAFHGHSRSQTPSIFLVARQRKGQPAPSVWGKQEEELPKSNSINAHFLKGARPVSLPVSWIIAVAVIVLLCCLNFRCKYVIDESLENRDLHQTTPVSTIDDPHLCHSKDSYKNIPLQWVGLYGTQHSALRLWKELWPDKVKASGDPKKGRDKFPNMYLCWRVLGMPKVKLLMSWCFNWQNSR